jgi:hypothetical protein
MRKHLAFVHLLVRQVASVRQVESSGNNPQRVWKTRLRNLPVGLDMGGQCWGVLTAPFYNPAYPVHSPLETRRRGLQPVPAIFSRFP